MMTFCLALDPVLLDIKIEDPMVYRRRRNATSLRPLRFAERLAAVVKPARPAVVSAEGR